MDRAGPEEFRRIALKRLSLKPDEYWRLTPIEAIEMVDGARWRHEQSYELAAWVTANLMNVSGKTTKKKITPAMLLGRKPGKAAQPRDAKRDFNELMRRQAVIDAKTAN